MKIDTFTKTATPLTCIVYFTNPVGIKLAEMLLEQGSKVVLIDSFTSDKKELVAKLVKHPNCLFMDIETTFSNIEKFKKIDYIYYFANQVIEGVPVKNAAKQLIEPKQVSHQSFVNETNRLDAYIKLSIEYRAKFLLATSGLLNQLILDLPEQNAQLQKYAESLFNQYYQKTKFNGRIVRIPEVYGEGANLNLPTGFNRMLREILFTNEVSIYGEGLQNNYFVNLVDAVYGLLKITFVDKTKGKTFFLAEPHPITTLNLAYKLLEITSTEKEVLFKDAEDIHHIEMSSYPHVLPAQESGWEPIAHFDEELKNIMPSAAESLRSSWASAGTEDADDFKENSSETLTKNDSYTKSPIKNHDTSIALNLYRTVIKNPFIKILSFFTRKDKDKKKKQSSLPWGKMFFVSAVVVGFLLIISPFVLFGIAGLQLQNSIQTVKSAIAERNIEKVQAGAKQMESSTQSLELAVNWLGFVRYFGPQVEEVYSETSNVIEGLGYYSQSFNSSSKGLSAILTYAQEFKIGEINETSGQTPREYSAELAEIKSQEEEIALASQYAQIGASKLTKVDTSVFPEALRGFLTGSINDAKLYSQAMKSLSDIYPFIPYLTGDNDRTNYLLMVQNESEIRATGGWFSNYAIVGIQNGRIRQLTVDDVYNIDGQTKAKPAPQAMQDGLGISSYTFSLSNWDPSVEKTAQEAESFLQSAGKVSDIDVAVTFNFNVIRRLLEVTGPIAVGGVGQVTAENLSSKVVELHSQFTPGSQQKVQLVSALVPVLIEELSNGPLEEKEKLLSVISQAVIERDIMVYSKNTEFNKQLENTYHTVIKPQEEESYLSVIDWNWSGNKTNDYVSRESKILIDLAAKQLTLTTSYRNTSTEDVYPQGIYKNYQRVYVPDSWKLSAISDEAKNIKEYVAEKGKFFGHMVQVGLVSSTSVSHTFSYEILGKTLYLPKQSGIKSELLEVSFIVPDTDTTTQSLLAAQGFIKTEEGWKKTMVRKEDIRIDLSQ